MRAATKVGALSALFSPVQIRILGLFFGRPDRRFRTGELIVVAQSGSGATDRQLRRLVAAGLVFTTRVGHKRYYQANAHSPLFADLRSLISKTVAIVEPVRLAFRPLSGIRAAFIYGTISEDIFLMVISDTLKHASVRHVLAPLEKSFARPINATILTTKAWRAWRSGSATEGIVMVVGDESDLELDPELP